MKIPWALQEKLTLIFCFLTDLTDALAHPAPAVAAWFANSGAEKPEGNGMTSWAPEAVLPEVKVQVKVVARLALTVAGSVTEVGETWSVLAVGPEAEAGEAPRTPATRAPIAATAPALPANPGPRPNRAIDLILCAPFIKFHWPGEQLDIVVRARPVLRPISYEITISSS